MRGNSKENLLKNAKGRLYCFLVCPKFNFFKVQVVCKAVHLSLWEIFVRKLSPVFFETQICPGPIATNAQVFMAALATQVK
ncbi:MAG TPA: hypothetical protein DGG95_11580 [Cytophagales bacterium]|nr:hypothetical protein [Cytophagales bacterium]